MAKTQSLAKAGFGGQSVLHGLWP